VWLFSYTITQWRKGGVFQVLNTPHRPYLYQKYYANNIGIQSFGCVKCILLCCIHILPRFKINFILNSAHMQCRIIYSFYTKQLNYIETKFSLCKKGNIYYAESFLFFRYHKYNFIVLKSFKFQTWLTFFCTCDNKKIKTTAQ